MMIQIKAIEEYKEVDIHKIVEKNWFSSTIVSRGKVHKIKDLKGFVAELNNNIKGIITFDMKREECEIVSLNSFFEGQGVATSLIDKVVDVAKEKEIRRICAVTTNDNTHAITYYQKLGFNMCKFNRNQIEESRKIKPEIPLFGYNNIPIMHELEFELLFD